MAAHMKKTEWDNIPEWAIYALEYGTEEDGSLNEEERAMIEKFVGTHFPKGYTMSVDWNACNEFDRYPAFGEPCKTCKVLCKYSINSLVYWVTYVHNVVYSFYRSMIYCYINSTQRCAGSIVIDIIPTNGADKRKFFPLPLIFL